MRRAVFYWISCLAVLAAGAAAVCPAGDCVVGDWDRAGLALAESLRSEGLDTVMRALTWLGSLLVLVPLVLITAAWLARAGRRVEAAFVVIALAGASLLSHAFKLGFSRPRPDLFPPLVPVPEDWSYPSAHTMQATAAAIAWVLVLARGRLGWAVAAAVAVLAVGWSRIHLQVHFPSDVLAGMLATVLWVAGLRALMLRQPATRAADNVGEGAA
jgi:undecaprenyl-diphosphatase